MNLWLFLRANQCLLAIFRIMNFICWWNFMFASAFSVTHEQHTLKYPKYQNLVEKKQTHTHICLWIGPYTILIYHHNLEVVHERFVEIVSIWIFRACMEWDSVCGIIDSWQFIHFFAKNWSLTTFWCICLGSHTQIYSMQSEGIRNRNRERVKEKPIANFLTNATKFLNSTLLIDPSPNS